MSGELDAGNIDEKTRAVFGRSYAGAPDELVAKLPEDEAIAAADTLLLTVPNQLGVEYNARVIDPDARRPGARLALNRGTPPGRTFTEPVPAYRCAGTAAGP